MAARGEAVLERNFAAVDGALAALHEVNVPARADDAPCSAARLSAAEPDFIRRVTRMLIEGKGDLLPVSAMPVDGSFPTGTSRLEKRSIALEIPIWDQEICIECGLCAMVCPHAAIRSKAYDSSVLEGAPADFPSRPWTGKELPGHSHDHPGRARRLHGLRHLRERLPGGQQVGRQAQGHQHGAEGRPPRARAARWDFFHGIPDLDRTRTKLDTVKGSQLLAPLFEFSGACAGCGETPYLKLMSQLFGDRAIIANATGCSSIYGGNLPTTPWAKNAEGRGPAWANSLFEDNAEFGLGIRMAVDQQQDYACHLLRGLAEAVGHELARPILSNPQDTEAQIREQRDHVAELKRRLAGLERLRRSPAAWRRSPTPWCGVASGSSAATAGPTTSASAAWTTSWPRAGTSTSWSSTPRSTRTPAARPRRRPPAPPSPSLPPGARRPPRRTWA